MGKAMNDDHMVNMRIEMKMHANELSRALR